MKGTKRPDGSLEFEVTAGFDQGIRHTADCIILEDGTALRLDEPPVATSKGWGQIPGGA